MKHEISSIKTWTESVVEIQNPERVLNIINKMFCNNGLSKLKVLADFDATLTLEYLLTGEKVVSSFNLFTKCNSIPEDMKSKFYELYKEYHPYESMFDLPEETRAEKMDEWCEKFSGLLIGLKFDSSDIETVTHGCEDTLRNRIKPLFQLLYKNNVPVFILSAGHGNCVLSILQKAGIWLPNVKVVSNFLKLNDDLLDGFERPMIHACNKNQALTNHNVYKETTDRNDIILMGDSLNDAHMAGETTLTDENILKIGFLNKANEENLKKYMDAFDIVLVEDPTMDFPTKLVESLLQNTV